MIDPIRTPAEALEAAAQIADEYHAKALEWAKTVRGLERHIGETDSSRIATAIRALAPRIPPALDGEALAEVCARALARTVVPDDPDGENERWPEWYDEARAVLAALREAEALR